MYIYVILLFVDLIQPPNIFQTARVGNKVGPGGFAMQEHSHAGAYVNSTHMSAYVSYFKTEQPPRHGTNSPGLMLVPRFP